MATCVFFLLLFISHTKHIKFQALGLIPDPDILKAKLSDYRFSSAQCSEAWLHYTQ